ncbi:MAG: hypothetical protein J0M12_01650 [Deltaproteobacteria bacterium]|nr:hypothetical protein [Deltaproteobacteria bacterium]
MVFLILRDLEPVYSYGKLGMRASRLLTLFFVLLCSPYASEAEFRFGACCSANGGVCGCQGGGAVCCDGKASTCPCNEKDFHVTVTVTPKQAQQNTPRTTPPEHLKYLPDPKLTPGDIRSRSKEEICAVGYIQKVGKTSNTAKEKTYERYKIARRSAYEIDHLVSKGLGGSNDPKNLWPQPHQALWNVHKKDELENLMHRMVCSGKLDLLQAQQEMLTDWISAYKKYIGDKPRPTPAQKKKSTKKSKKQK